LKNVSQLDLHGVSDSGGVWAPDLSHDGSRFRLVYTNVKHRAKDAPFSDTLNYLATAEQITGPWSDPVFLNSSGFDPSLFHDATHRGGTGQEWLLNMRRDHRLNRNMFSGILLQEFNSERAHL
jgi:xylan 1,4-beta-xylosidase